MNIRKVPLDDLVLDPNLNLRDRLDDFTVERYADSWDRLPPITVFEVEGRLLLADGFHRHAAAIMMGKRTIPAEVRDGTMPEALDFVSSVNLFHGLPLTRAERRRAVEVKLKLHHDWSDRRMAEELAVSRELVAKIRRQLIESHQIPNLPGRVGSDGKLYTSAGLPKDANERLPRDNKEAGGEDEPVEAGAAAWPAAPPWEETGAVAVEAPGPPEPAYDLAPAPRETRAAALVEPVEPVDATIDEMLESWPSRSSKWSTGPRPKGSTTPIARPSPTSRPSSRPPSTTWGIAPINSSSSGSLSKDRERSSCASEEFAEDPVGDEHAFAGEAEAIAVVLEVSLGTKTLDGRTGQAVDLEAGPEPKILPIEAQLGPAEHQDRRLAGPGFGG